MRELEEIIKDAIRRDGPMSFDRFMEYALYEPGLGYYSSGRATIGKAGDFYTNPSTGPVFGRLVAEVFSRLREQLPDTAAFIEIGAGEGHFARDFLEHMKAYHDDEKVRYVIIERSDGMAEKQRATLGQLARNVEWRLSLDGLPGPIDGIFFSNELLDAMPFHRVRVEDGRLKELFVALVGDYFTEVAGGLSDPNIPRYFNRLLIGLQDGMETEVNLRMLGWMRDVAGKLGNGFVITVDYGLTACEYFSPARSHGTLRCYHKHTQNDNPYSRIGDQDITAHVDFSSVAMVGKNEGVLPIFFSDQTSFLMTAIPGLEAAMMKGGASREEFEKAAQGMKALLHPDWMGSAFSVLVQSKGISDTEGLFGSSRNRVESLFL